MIEVEAPDGSIVEFPAGTSPDVMAAAMRRRFGGPQPADQSQRQTNFAVNPSAAPAPPISSPVGSIPYQQQDQAVRPPPTTGERVGRALGVGTSGAVQGLLELGLTPPEMAAGAFNLGSQLFGSDVRVPSPTQAISGAVRGFTGLPSPESMSPQEQLGFNINRFGSQAAATIPALAGMAASRGAQIAAGNAAPRMGDAFLKPYMSNNVGRTIAGDAAAAAGAGAAVTGYEQFASDSVRQNLGPGADAAASGMSAMGGGLAGAGVLQAAEGLGRLLMRVLPDGIQRALPGASAPQIPVDPLTGNAVPLALQREAAGLFQSGVSGGIRNAADNIAAGIEQNRNAGLPDATLPTPAALSQDSGLMGVETSLALRERGPAIDAARARASALRDVVDSTAPVGAQPQAFQQGIQDRLSGAQRRIDANNANAEARGAQEVAQAEQMVAGTGEMARRQAQTLAPIADATAQNRASTAADQVITGDMQAAAEARRQAFQQARADTVPVDVSRIQEAAQRARDMGIIIDGIPEVNRPAPRSVTGIANSSPETTTTPSAILDEFGRPFTREQTTGGVEQITLAQLDDLDARLRGQRAAAERAARNDPTGQARLQSQALGEVIDAVDAEMVARAGSNPDLARAMGLRQAENARYRQQGAGDPASELRTDIQSARRDFSDRSTTPPSRTLNSYFFSEGPERLDALARTVRDSSDPAAAGRAVNDFIESRFAMRVFAGDPNNPSFNLNAARDFVQKEAEALQRFPEAAARIQRYMDEASRAGKLGEAANANLAAARDRVTADSAARRTSDAARKAAFERTSLGVVLDADPDRIIPTVLNRPDAQQEMARLVAMTRDNPAARDGLKAAVQNHLVDRIEGRAAMTAAGDNRGAIRPQALRDLLDRHDGVLSQIYTPDEMAKLQQVRRNLDLQDLQNVNARAGSQTVERANMALRDKLWSSGLGQGMYALMVGNVGALRAGSYRAVISRALDGLPSNQPAMDRLLARAVTDPDVAMALLNTRVREPVSAANRALMRAISVGEVLRAYNAED